MSYLIVVAHPDDEVLGAGATIHKLTSQGKKVDVCIMASKALARAYRPEDNELEEDMNHSMKLLGVNKVFLGDFPNIKLNTVPHLHLVQFIEKAIKTSKADVVFTHHPCDTNNDHMHTSIACQAAIRLYQRKPSIGQLKEFLYMEILSSTDWAVNSAMNKFNPNVFVEVGSEGVDTKIKALSAYRGVIRPYPHPRSVETIAAIAAYRGSQSGLKYAESFESVFRTRISD